MSEARVFGTRKHKVAYAELPDPAESLQLRRLNKRQQDTAVNGNEAVNGIRENPTLRGWQTAVPDLSEIPP